MATINDLKKVFAFLDMSGARNPPDMVGKTEEATIQKEERVFAAWELLLKDIPGEEVLAAAVQFSQGSPFWPHPSEIRKLCPSLHRKQLESETKKESGTSWFSKVVARAGDFGPNATGSMEFLKGSLATYVKSADPWGTGCANIAKSLAEGNPAIHAALAAGIDAVGWREFHREGWKFRENRMRDVFERAFAVAYDKYLLDNPKFNVIDFQEKKRIASQGAW
jgi:hypothetical protein